MTSEYSESSQTIRRLSVELNALAESGLAFTTNQFDIERFHRVGAIAEELMNLIRTEPGEEYSQVVASTAGYTTPKLDVRGGVFNEEGRVLLVRELADNGRWTLPGGWCDVLDSPSEAVEREVFEEAGIRTKVTQLAAVLDRDKWPHWPPLDKHLYKMFFVCEPLEKLDLDYVSNETGGVGWFSVNDLPEMSIGRTLPEQVQLLHRHWLSPGIADVD